MKTTAVSELIPKLKLHGRTLYRSQEDVLWFNWTNSGMELHFCGTLLMADFTATAGFEMDPPPMGGEPKPRETWPWLGVAVDGVLVRSFEVRPDCAAQLLFSANQPEVHRIRLVKLTENGKGYLGLKSITIDGEIRPMPVEAMKKIQFIGDSITCGFGNATNEKDRLFFSSDENSWFSHGAVTARTLGMDETIVSSSGIAVTLYPGWFHQYGMDDLYPYADRMLEDKLGVAEYTPWDFSQDEPDYIVLNLGTNDANAIQMMGEDAGKQMHLEKYTAFLKMLRKSHGEKPHIICALGTMDYYLLPEIEKAAAHYTAETGDTNISFFRYPKMFFLDPIGACGHPNIVTHEKMADAMAEYIRKLEANKV